MGILVVIFFLIGAFMFCTLIASWFVDGSAAILVVAVLIFAGIWAASSNKK